MSIYSHCMFMYLHCTGWHSSAALTEVYLCIFLSCKANARVKLAKTGHGPHSSKFLRCSVYCLFLCHSMYCLCVNVYYCHRVATQLQLTNISYQFFVISDFVKRTLYYQTYLFHFYLTVIVYLCSCM